MIASTSWAFFIDPAPGIPMPDAIDLRSAISMVLSPPPRFFESSVRVSGAVVVDSLLSVT